MNPFKLTVSLALLDKVCVMHRVDQIPNNFLLNDTELLCILKTKNIAESDAILQDLNIYDKHQQ